MRFLTLFGAGLLALGVMIVGWVKYQERYGIFYPTSYRKDRLKQLPPSIEYVEFSSTDGLTLTGLYRGGDRDKPGLLLAHGNAGNMIDRLPWFRTALPDGWSGIIFDYRGYGQSDGTPSVAGAKKDVRAAANLLLQRTKTTTLYLHGRSLGVPFVAYASQYVTVQGMILESGFPDAPAVAHQILPFPGTDQLITTSLDTIDYLKTAHQQQGPFPKLILHGSDDQILPVQLGRSLYERAPKPKKWWLVEGAGHNNLRITAGPTYRETLVDFLKSAPQNEPRSGGATSGTS